MVRDISVFSETLRITPTRYIFIASVFSQYNAFCKVHNIYGTDSSRPKSKESVRIIEFRFINFSQIIILTTYYI